MEKMPWGCYFDVYKDKSIRMKKIYLKREQRFSYHHHTKVDELWYLQSGILSAVIGEEDIILKPGESVLIPKNTMHRARNISNADVVLLELQIGTIVDDDVVRDSDDYGRC